MVHLGRFELPRREARAPQADVSTVPPLRHFYNSLKRKCIPISQYKNLTRTKMPRVVPSRLPFNNLLYLEQEALILVFRVPQSIQKVKTAKFHKH